MPVAEPKLVVGLLAEYLGKLFLPWVLDLNLLVVQLLSFLSSLLHFSLPR